jgi:hypothetical protein
VTGSMPAAVVLGTGGTAVLTGSGLNGSIEPAEFEPVAVAAAVQQLVVPAVADGGGGEVQGEDQEAVLV